MRKVAILAAGVGRRLQPLTNDRPKALLELGGRSLLELQLLSLAENGVPVSDVVVITGHKHERLSACATRLGASVLLNPDFESTNNIVSLHCLARTVGAEDLDELLIVNCDIVAHPGIFRSLTLASQENAVVVDTTQPPSEEAMKVHIREGRVWRFGKTLEPALAQGEYIGLARLGADGVRGMFDVTAALVRAGDVDEWYEEGFNRIAEHVELRPLDTRGLPWTEIDTPEDYNRAQAIYQDFVS